MQTPSHDPHEQGMDPDRTDTLPVLALREELTGTHEMPGVALPPQAEPVRVRPRLAVRDASAQDPHVATDTFQRLTPAPLAAARPVDTPELAAALREQEHRLGEALERISQLERQLAEAKRREEELEEACAELHEAAQQAAAAQGDARTDPASAPHGDGGARAAAPGDVSAATSAVAVDGDATSSLEAPPASDAAWHPVDDLRQAPVAPPNHPEQREIEALRRQVARLHESLSSMHARIGVQEALVAEAEDAVAAAEQRAARAEENARGAPKAFTSLSAPAESAQPQPGAEDATPLRVDWQARFIELEAILEAERASAAALAQQHAEQLAALQAGLAAAQSQLAVSATPDAAAATRPRPVSIALRVLVRQEDGNEFVYPLGRHTTIGRTPDNDIQVNTNFVSRHHAVLLAGSEHCIVEDLNSTNGIQVNGHRVSRQLLHEGDVLTIGRTHFRYETRP